jgi:hypothetical protein
MELVPNRTYSIGQEYVAEHFSNNAAEKGADMVVSVPVPNVVGIS